MSEMPGVNYNPGYSVGTYEGDQITEEFTGRVDQAHSELQTLLDTVDSSDPKGLLLLQNKLNQSSAATQMATTIIDAQKKEKESVIERLGR